MKYFIWLTIILSIVPHAITVTCVIMHYAGHTPKGVMILLQVLGIFWALFGVIVSYKICEKYKLY